MYTIPEFKGPFRELIPQFINYKRALGYDYGRTIVYRLLAMNRFFLSNGIRGIEIPEDIFIRWINLNDDETASNQQKRYTVIHGFAKFLIQNKYPNIYDTPNPVHKKDDFVPYIYSDDEILKIFRAADNFSINHKAYDHSIMLPVLLRLLYSTGMRISEALNLKLRDVDFDKGNLYIWDGKNHVDRMISISTSMKRVLASYREKMMFFSADNYLFHGCDGQPYSYGVVRHVFHLVLSMAGISRRPSGNYPRIHDVRHVFSVRALEQMERQGYDLYTSLPLLSKYLGHKSIIETEYYIRLTQSSFSRITDLAYSYSPHLFPRMEGCE